MAVACHGGESGNSVGANEVIDFAALDVCAAVIAAAKTGVSCSGPRLGDTGRKVLRIRAKVQSSGSVAPDLPRRLRFQQPIEKPSFLFGAENRLRWLVLAEIRKLLAAETNGFWWMAAVVGAASVEYLECFLRKKFRKILAGKDFAFRPVAGIFRAIAALVGDDQFNVAAPTHRSITLEAGNRREVVGFLSQSVLVKTRDRRVLHLRRIELTERRPARLEQSCRLIFEEGLIGGYFARLRRARDPLELLQGLPAQPAEFVVVPHADERKIGASVLQIRIAQVPAIDRAIVVKHCGNVKVAVLFAMLVANDVP